MIDSLTVDVGDRVRRGQVLATLKRAEVDAAVSQASESVEKARRDLERAKQLRADEVATEEQVQDLTTAYRVAHANHDAARFNARYARIEAPSDGVVLERLAEADELVQGGQPVLVRRRDGHRLDRARRARGHATRCASTSTTRRKSHSTRSRASRFAGKVTRVGGRRRSADGHVRRRDRSAPGTARASCADWSQRSRSRLTRGTNVAATSTLVPVSALVEANGSTGIVYVLDATGTSPGASR